jgi:dihydrodipicolinate synthase/N-acetylneuraminate lyase
MLATPVIDPIGMLRPRRKIHGISAILLPFTATGEIDWTGFTAHCVRTADTGLIPAVNMDTGFANLLTHEQRTTVLEVTRSCLGGRPFVAGVFVADTPGDAFNREAYLRSLEPILHHGGTPIFFQSHGLTELPDAALIAAYEDFGRQCDEFIAFELGTMFARFGKIYSLELYAGLMGVKQCTGAKHSSLERKLEWERLALRDRLRPEFRVYSGNDLAIDMIMYGSDYLLGLSTFAPDVFALRDRFWETGDARFYELNDILQYLGFLAFRDPVPAYKHSAAMFLKLRGWIECDATHPASAPRPESDRELLRGIIQQLKLASNGL